MEKKWTKSVRSMIALLLCAAMLLPMLPQVVVRADTTGSTSGFSGTIVPSTEVTTQVTTDTKNFQLVPVALTNRSAGNGHNWLISGGSYAIGNYNGTQLLAYSAVGKTEPTASNMSVPGFAVQADASGNITFNPIYRDEVMWKLTQDTATGTAFTMSSNNSWGGQGMLNNSSNQGWAAQAAFQSFTIAKGTGKYWYTTGSDTYRYLDLSVALNEGTISTAMFNNARSNGAGGYHMEYYGDGVFQIYHAGSHDSTYNSRDINFLKWDNNNWTVGSFFKTNRASDASVGSQSKAYDRLHLKLYHYEELSTYRKLNYKGYNRYDVMQGETVDDIVAKIQSDITMTDTNRYTIPYSGTTAKVGYYWLDTTNFTSNAVGEYTVNVNYCNDDGTPKTVSTITVNIEDVTLGKNLHGYISKNSQYSASVYDGVTATANEITMSFAGQTVPVTVNMLYNADGSRLDLTQAGDFPGVQVKSGEKVIGTMTVTIANGTIVPHTPVTPGAGSVSVDKTGVGLNAVDGKGNNLANVQLSALGTAKDTGVDLIVVLDLSSSMRYGANTSFEVTGPYYNYKGELNTTGYHLDYSTFQYVDSWAVKTGTQAAKDGHYKNYDETAWKDTRMYDLEVALESMIKTLQDNDTTDVRIAITDFGDLDHYEFTDAVIDKNQRLWPVLDSNANNNMNYQNELTNHLNFVLGRDDYQAGAIWAKQNGDSKNWVSQPFDLHEWKYFSNDALAGLGVAEAFRGKQNPTVYTASDKKSISAEAFVDVDTLTGTTFTNLITELRISNSKMLGTNYDVGLEYAYKLAYERQQANIAAGEDREIMCVFMSDGAAMQYNYFSGRSITDAWSQMIIGKTDEVLTNHEDAANFNIIVNAQGEYVFEDYASLTPKFQYVLGVMHNWLATGNKLEDHNVGKIVTACGCGQKSGTEMANLQAFGEGLPTCLHKLTGNPVTMYDIFRDLYKNRNIVRNGLKDYYAWVVLGYTENQATVTVTETIIDAVDENGNITYKNVEVVYPRQGTETDSYNKSMLELIRELTAPNNGDAYQTMSPYYYFYNAEGKNWWAEAIKGDVDKVYPVINKYAKGNTASGASNPSYYNGETGYLNNFAGETDISNADNTTYYTAADGTRKPLELSGKDYISGFKGLGMRLYTVGFAIATENLITAEEANTVLQNLASGPNYYYSTANRGELTTALNSIVSEVTQASTFGYFTDTMGEEFDLYARFTEDGLNYTGTYYDATGTKQNYAITNNSVIRVFKADKSTTPAAGQQYAAVTNGLLEEIEITTYGVAKSTVYEYVTNTDGSITTNTTVTADVWDETRNIIQGKYVVYNLNKLGSGDTTLTDSAAITASLLAGNNVNGTVMINLDTDTDLDFRLAPETFFWTIGNIPQEYRIVLEYQAYMEESYAGTLALKDQNYATNAQATLTYVDYLGNLVTKDTVSPELPWKEQALYQYAYYLVDTNGDPVWKDGVVGNYTFFTKSDGTYYTGVVSSVEKDDTSTTKTTTVATQDIVNNVPTGDYVLYDSNAGATISTTLASVTSGEDGETIKVPDKHTITPNDPSGNKVASTLVKDDTAEVSGIENGDLRNNIIYFAVYIPPKSTTIKFSFYLVNEDGTPVGKDGQPTTNGWSNSFKLTDAPTLVEQTIGETTVPLTPESKLAAYCEKNGLDANLFEIYDSKATAEVTADFTSANHKVTLSKDEDEKKKPSTYVDGPSSDPTNATGEHTISGVDALTTTEISFAVKLISQAVDEIIVVDYGLPVNIDVIANDKISDMKVNGISADAKGTVTAYAGTGKYGNASFGDVYGNVEINGDKVIKYTPNTMSFTSHDLFSYEASYSVTTDGVTKNYYYTANVTVVPATTIYYEDSFDGITYEAYKYNGKVHKENGYEVKEADKITDPTDPFMWTTSGTAIFSDQDEDRPGADVTLNDDGTVKATDVLGAADMDSIYGYDTHYTAMQTHSMGSAHMVKVDKDHYAVASFTFTGTGFDVISVTSNTTGAILVTATNKTTRESTSKLVNTYYGYSYENGVWTESEKDNALYQIPVIKMNGLTHGTYDVTIKVSYMSVMDKTGEDAYDFYLDAIRVYDPANDGEGNDVIEGAYTADGEGWPEYFELRNLILSTGDLNLDSTHGTVNGAVFIDGNSKTGNFSVKDYMNYGPNNELYLAPNQSIAFTLNVDHTNMDKIHMAMKSVGKVAAKVKIYKLNNGTLEEMEKVVPSDGINTATDLYYDITTLNGSTLVISNEGGTADAILSITNVKVTYKAAHTDSMDSDYIKTATDNVQKILDQLNDTAQGNLPETEKNGITMMYASLSLEDEVHVNYYFTVDNSVTLNKDNTGLLFFETNPGDDVAYADADAVVEGYVEKGTTTANEKLYAVQSPGIPAKKLADTQYVCVYVKNGENYAYGPTVAYSPKEYATAMYNSTTDAKLKDLCAALLNYGAWAQTYFNYNVLDQFGNKADGFLANSGLPEAAKKWTWDSGKYAPMVTTSGITATGFGAQNGITGTGSITLDGALALNFYFMPTEQLSGNITLYYWDDGETTLTKDNATKQTLVNTGSSYYSVRFTDIAAKDMKKPIYVVAECGSYSSGVMAFSVNNYCAMVQDADTANTSVLESLTQATAIYGYYADKYFNNTNG